MIIKSTVLPMIFYLHKTKYRHKWFNLREWSQQFSVLRLASNVWHIRAYCFRIGTV